MSESYSLGGAAAAARSVEITHKEVPFMRAFLHGLSAKLVSPHHKERIFGAGQIRSPDALQNEKLEGVEGLESFSYYGSV